MYHVIVHADGKRVDSESFAFGEWSEIGFWLDGRGYISEGHHVTVTFSA